MNDDSATLFVKEITHTPATTASESAQTETVDEATKYSTSRRLCGRWVYVRVWDPSCSTVVECCVVYTSLNRKLS
jgi:hypothetical protein